MGKRARLINGRFFFACDDLLKCDEITPVVEFQRETEIKNER